MKPTYEELESALRELVDAIGKRWDGEGEKKRANAISPRMEKAIDTSKRLLGIEGGEDEIEALKRRLKKLRAEASTTN